MKFIICYFLIFTAFASETVCTTKYKNILRAEADSKSSQVRVLPKYTPLIVLDTQENWLKVKGVEYEGWIYKTLVSDELSCMVVKNHHNPYCLSSSPRLGRDLTYHEGFKILKKEIGCNEVVDKWGKKTWLANVNIWPLSESKHLIIQ